MQLLSKPIHSKLGFHETPEAAIAAHRELLQATLTNHKDAIKAILQELKQLDEISAGRINNGLLF